jgi:hypothetical protein
VAARRRYEASFTLDKMTGAYHALYDRLIGQTAELAYRSRRRITPRSN